MFNENVNLPTIKVLGAPILTMLITITLLVVVVRSVGPEIPAQLETIRSTQSDVGILRDKVDILQSFNADVASDRSDITYVALPDNDPAAVVISQLNGTLASSGVSQLENLQYNSSSTGIAGNYSNTMSFEFTSDQVENVIDVLQKIQLLAPIVTIEEVGMDIGDAGVSTALTLSLYWSDLPDKLPEVDSPVSQLNTVERNVLNKLLTFTLPNYSLVNPSPPSTDRQNPFN